MNCPPGYRLLSEVRDEIGEDVLLAMLAKQECIAHMAGPKGIVDVQVEVWRHPNGPKYIRSAMGRPFPFAMNPVPLLLAVADLKRKARTARAKGGRPPSADWDAIEEALKREIEGRGWPEPLNVDGWQRLADVERWIAEKLEREGVRCAASTTRERAGKMLAKLKPET